MPKKLNFLEALAIAGKRKRIRRVFEVSDTWSLYSRNKDCGQLLDSNGVFWWPTGAEQEAEIWEVETKPVDILVYGVCDIVYGVCDEDGLSVIFNEHPQEEDGSWHSGETLNCLVMSEVDLFSKKIPQKFKLVPAGNGNGD